jgi:hypothetical protein
MLLEQLLCGRVCDLYPVSLTANVRYSRRRIGGGVKSFVLDSAAVVQSPVAAHRAVEGVVELELA